MPSRLSISPMSQSRRRKIVRWRGFEVKHSQYTLCIIHCRDPHITSRRPHLQCAGNSITANHIANCMAPAYHEVSVRSSRS